MTDGLSPVQNVECQQWVTICVVVLDGVRIMKRRKFFGAIAGLIGIAVFPRKSESAQSDEGLSHEQMAEAILNHPHTVFLHGDAHDFGMSRSYSSARLAGEWHTAILSNQIHCDYTLRHSKQTTTVSGCIVGTRHHSVHLNRVTDECRFDISNPLLKIICLLDTPNRYFTRLKERWVELC